MDKIQWGKEIKEVGERVGGPGGTVAGAGCVCFFTWERGVSSSDTTHTAFLHLVFESLAAKWVTLWKPFPDAETARHEHTETAITYYCLSQMLKWTGWKKYSFHTLKNYSKLF